MAALQAKTFPQGIHPFKDRKGQMGQRVPTGRKNNTFAGPFDHLDVPFRFNALEAFTHGRLRHI